MLIKKLKANLTQYDLCTFTPKNYDALYALHRSNPLYYKDFQSQPIARQDSVKDLNTLPPNTARSQKHYIGFYRGNQLEAVIDLIDHYPKAHTAWIGLLMVDARLSSKASVRRLSTRFLTRYQRLTISQYSLAL